MSIPNRRLKATLAGLPGSKHYDVGYGKPPLETRFQPGQSGNPGGRPQGSKNKPKSDEDIESIFLDEARREITIQKAGRPISMSMARAVSRSVSMSAAKGNYRQQRLFLELSSKFNAAQEQRKEKALEIVIGYKIEWERELERRAKLGESGPEPVPHPDQIHINFDTGDITIFGPKTKQEKNALEAEVEALNKAMKEPVHERIKELLAELASETNGDLRKDIQAEIEDRKRVLDMIDESSKQTLRYLTTGRRPAEWKDE